MCDRVCEPQSKFSYEDLKLLQGKEFLFITLLDYLSLVYDPDRFPTASIGEEGNDKLSASNSPKGKQRHGKVKCVLYTTLK